MELDAILAKPFLYLIGKELYTRVGLDALDGGTASLRPFFQRIGWY
jgi:hypothetical protein